MAVGKSPSHHQSVASAKGISQQLEVPLRGGDAAVAEDLREVKEIPACTKVHHREGVAQGGEGSPHTCDAQLTAQHLEITQQVALRKDTSVPRAEDKLMLVGL
jgi:hypothetical protein